MLDYNEAARERCVSAAPNSHPAQHNSSWMENKLDGQLISSQKYSSSEFEGNLNPSSARLEILRVADRDASVDTVPARRHPIPPRRAEHPLWLPATHKDCKLPCIHHDLRRVRVHGLCYHGMIRGLERERNGPRLAGRHPAEPCKVPKPHTRSILRGAVHGVELHDLIPLHRTGVGDVHGERNNVARLHGRRSDREFGVIERRVREPVAERVERSAGEEPIGRALRSARCVGVERHLPHRGEVRGCGVPRRR